MCGIAGLVLRHGAAREDSLRRMADQLIHRGPEDTGHYLSEGFGIAHTRLAIIDLAGGHQPLLDDEGRYALVCNGEIYNFIELRAELQALGCRFLTHSDSEVALQAFRRWGPDSFRRLHGMFAFALYDHAARELWLVRDRLGIKPLYYAPLPDRLLFGSELKALIAGLPQAPQVHAPALAQFFQSQYSTGAECMVQGIRRLGPGEAIRVRADLSIEHHCYWTPAPAALQLRSHEEAVEAWEPLFEQVMREHMRSDVPFGMFLSGGIDSALVLAMLKRFHNQPIRSYSIGFSDAPERNELDDAQRVAERLGSQHQAILLDSQAVLSRLVRATWAADDLIADHACMPTLALAEAASRELKVVFTGEGGDEAFAGYARYRPHFAKQALKRLMSPRAGGYRSSGDFDGAWLRRVFRPEFRAPLRAFRQPIIEAWERCPREWNALQKRQVTDLRTMLADDLLVKVDRSLMAASMEARVPFLDHRVIEFGLGLPDRLKIEGRTGKLFLKRWAERFLPREQIWKPKRGFHVPIGRMLTPALLDALEQALPQSAGIQQWCEPDAVRALVRRQREAGDLAPELWRLMQFAVWHRLFIAAPGATPGPRENLLDWILP